MMKLPQNPIFIVGYPRSGTTLLQRMLAVQPGLYTFPETHYFNVVEKAIRWDNNAAEEIIDQDSLPAILGKIYEKMRLRFTEAENADLMFLAANKKLSSKKIFETIVSHYLMILDPDITDNVYFRWIEKTPNHAHFLERIVSMYPEAQVLHVLRHPVPAIYSRKLKFPFNKDTPVAELARRWNRMVLDVEAFIQKYPGHIYSLRYEDLVGDLDKQFQGVAAFLNINAGGGHLAFLEERNKRHTEQFILPSEKWKLDDLKLEMNITNHHYRDMTDPEETGTIEEITMEIMNRYGYKSFGENA